MEYIPKSTIIKEETQQNNWLSPEDNLISLFWVNFGIEHVNLRNWSLQCFDILQCSFGRSYNKYTNSIILDNLFSKLSYDLDSMVGCYYPLSENYIQIDDKKLAQDINRYRQIKNNQVLITSVFYNIKTIKYYPMKYNYKGKTFSSKDKEYILKFIKRFGIYLEYLEYIIDKLPINLNVNYEPEKIINGVRETIIKMKNKYNKMNIINDIIVKEKD